MALAGPRVRSTSLHEMQRDVGRVRTDAFGLNSKDELERTTMKGLHLAGCMLYWAEGAKSRNTIEFANSDPNMVRLFCRFSVSASAYPMSGSECD